MIRKFSLAIVALLGMIVPGVAMAQSPELNICTGGNLGKYYEVASQIGVQAKGLVKVNVIETNGSMDNLGKLSDGTCDAAIVQSDAYGIFTDTNPTLKLNIERVTPLYNEYVHLVCNQSANINQVGDILRGGVKLLVGPNGSGTNVTWQTWGQQAEKYQKVTTEPMGGQRALNRVISGVDAQCMLFVAGLKSGSMLDVNLQGKGKLQLVSINDGAFDDVKDPQGTRVYAFHDVPKGTYPNLQNSGWFGSGNGVPTLTMEAVLVANVSWIDANPKAFDNFSRAANLWATQNNK